MENEHQSSFGQHHANVIVVDTSPETRAGSKELDMRNANGITLLAFLLVLGVTGVGAHMVSSSPDDVVDPCYGYAIC